MRMAMVLALAASLAGCMGYAGNEKESEMAQTARKLKEKEQALLEVEELEAKRAEANLLKGLEVKRSRYYKEESMWLGREARIELTVKNNLDIAISCAYFKGVLASPNRAVPWHSGNFSYQIPGGLEPEEEATWKLAPNMFGPWARVDAPENAIFTIEVVRLDGPDGNKITSNTSFSPSDSIRLAELKSQYEH